MTLYLYVLGSKELSWSFSGMCLNALSLRIEGKILPTGHCLGVMLLNDEGTQRLSIVKLLL